MIEISKELLEEILKVKVLRYKLNEKLLRYDYFENGVEYTSFSINIYELAHKNLKEWANKQGYDVLSSCNSDGRVWVQLHEYDTKLISSTEYFHSFFEVESTIKACEWILKEIKK